MGLLSRLVLGSAHFAQQFAHLGGLHSQVRARLGLGFGLPKPKPNPTPSPSPNPNPNPNPSPNPNQAAYAHGRLHVPTEGELRKASAARTQKLTRAKGVALGGRGT